ncbi:hypothetical protein AbraIFM66950_000302 [Aspergillus brasiliensis]|nr:hypothetical protein AbraIFM66950_000302 [Aspergillus brasiliensis]
MIALDPVRTKCVSSAIFVAIQQGRRQIWRKKLHRPRGEEAVQIPLLARKLPIEILDMIFDYLPSHTVATAEQALGIRVSNTFWYCRIVNNFFFEIESLPVEKTAWKRLCLKLEERIPESEALRVRQYLFNCMDSILAIVGMLEEGSLIDWKRF